MESFSVLFRTSKRFGKNPIQGVDCRVTYASLLESFEGSEIVCICDNATSEQEKFFLEHAFFSYNTRLGNCGSFRLALRLAEMHPADVYYFVEDDHLHLPLQKEWLLAGLSEFDFVSLYDHPDKYILPLYGSLKRRVVATAYGHFADVPSTVMTFACRRETLEKAMPTFLDSRFTGDALSFPYDHGLFLELRQSGFSLGTAIPGRSTHCEAELLSPYVDWKGYAQWLSDRSDLTLSRLLG